MGYVGLVEKLEKELGHKLTDHERGDWWARARVDEEGEYMNKKIKEIAQKIVS